MSESIEGVPEKMDPKLELRAQAQLEIPKGTQGVFELPCGYLDDAQVLHTEVHVREITGKEEDMLASKAIPYYKKVTLLIESCVTRLGSYEGPQLRGIGEKLLVGDRVFLMFAIRRVSLGDAYPFKATCPNPDCKREGLFELPLDQLEVKKMENPARRIFDAVLPSGRKIRWRPLNGKDEEELAKARNTQEGRSFSMFLRSLMINDLPPTLQDIVALGMRDRNALWDEFDTKEGGVQTTMEMSCPRCLHEWDEEMGVDQMGFFSPTAARRAWKAKSSTS